MKLFETLWPDLFGVAFARVFLNGGLRGAFYTHGKGGSPKLIASVKSPFLRFVFLMAAFGLVAWVVTDLKRKIQFT